MPPRFSMPSAKVNENPSTCGTTGDISNYQSFAIFGDRELKRLSNIAVDKDKYFKNLFKLWNSVKTEESGNQYFN